MRERGGKIRDRLREKDERERGKRRDRLREKDEREGKEKGEIEGKE